MIHCSKSSRGFTLIEVLITVMILGTLTVLAARSMQQAVVSKNKIQEQIDDVSKMRDSLRIMERDINLAFHYRDIEKELETLIKKYQKPPGANPPPGSPAAEAPPIEDPAEDPRLKASRADPTTQFIGNEDSVHFVTKNNGRLTTRDYQADYAEVSYSVKECRSLSEGKSSSRCLWRRHSSFVDEDVTIGGTEVVLLENVSEFNLKYLGKGKQDWVTTWKTDGTGDAVTQKNFPLAVEISLTLERENKGKTKKYSMQFTVPLHFPNNPPPPAGAANANTQ